MKEKATQKISSFMGMELGSSVSCMKYRPTWITRICEQPDDQGDESEFSSLTGILICTRSPNFLTATLKSLLLHL